MAGLIHFSAAASLGMHALLLLGATPGTARDNRTLAGALGVSAHHLSKVLQRLQHAGLVTSTRGPGGGFRLAQPAREVSLFTVYQAIDGTPDRCACLLGKSRCPAGRCVFGSLLTDSERAIEQHLRNTTLASLAAPEPAGKPEPKEAHQ